MLWFGCGSVLGFSLGGIDVFSFVPLLFVFVLLLFACSVAGPGGPVWCVQVVLSRPVSVQSSLVSTHGFLQLSHQ